MRRAVVAMAAVAALSLLLIVVRSAQGAKGRGGDGRGPGGGYARLFNPKTVETLTGEVITVNQTQHGRGGFYGVHLRLKTGKETVTVHLGPGWYLANQGFQVKAKERIEVKGSRVTYDRKPAIIAAEVRKGDKILRLRDKDGVPMWSGGKRR